jgi:hypothetical protein
MITLHDVIRLMERPASGTPVLSLFLDLRGGAEHQHARGVFLARTRAHLDELAAGWPGLRRTVLEDALDRAERWLAEPHDPAITGAAIFVEAGGAGLEALALPLPLRNETALDVRPVVAPLVRALQGQRRQALVVVDREHVRLLGVWLGTVLEEETVRADPSPAAHDVAGAGYDQQRYQRRKLEETRHIFHAFAAAVAGFVTRFDADEVILLGTDENVGRFRRFLPPHVEEQVVHTAAAPVDAPAAVLMERLAKPLGGGTDPWLEDVMDLLRERAGTGYRAATGLQASLEALQEGGVEALVLADDRALRGGRCSHCGFLFAEARETCPYDGATVFGGVPVVEEALRLAASQGADARLVAPEEAREFAGAGALLRF